MSHVEITASRAVPSLVLTVSGNTTRVVTTLPASVIDERLSIADPTAWYSTAFNTCGKCGYRGNGKYNRRPFDGVFHCLNASCKAVGWTKWDGRKHFYSVATRGFPTGLLWETMTWPDAEGLTVNVSDSTGVYPHLPPEFLLYRDMVLELIGEQKPRDVPAFLARNAACLRTVFPGVIPDQLGDKVFRPYQREAVEAACLMGGGVVHSPTGSGKSLIGAGILYAYGGGMLIVKGRDLLAQSREVFHKYLGEEIGIIGENTVDYRKYTVASIDTLDSRSADPEVKRILKTVPAVVNDETHHATSKTWYSVLMKITTPLHWGMSGTPYRRMVVEDMKLSAVVGPLVFDLPTTTLQEAGYLSKAVLTLVDNQVPSDRGMTWQAVRKFSVVENIERNDTIVRMAAQRSESGKKILIIVGTSIAHGRALETLLQERHPALRTRFVAATEDGVKETTRLRHEINSGDVDIAIATIWLDEGIDCPDLDCVLLAYGGKSYVKIVQRIGRGLRPKVNGVEVIDFKDKGSRFLSAHSRARQRFYEEEGIFMEIQEVVV